MSGGFQEQQPFRKELTFVNDFDELIAIQPLQSTIDSYKQATTIGLSMGHF
jgi:hypothetical protein